MFMLTPGRCRLRRTRNKNVRPACARRHYRSLVLMLVLCATQGLTAVSLGLCVWRSGKRARVAISSRHCPLQVHQLKAFFSSASMQKAQESVHRRLASTKHFDLQYSVVLMHAHDNIRTAVILLSPLSRICNCFFLRCLQFSCPFSTLLYSKGGFLWSDPDQIMVHQREPMNRL